MRPSMGWIKLVLQILQCESEKKVTAAADVDGQENWKGVAGFCQTGPGSQPLLSWTEGDCVPPTVPTGDFGALQVSRRGGSRASGPSYHRSRFILTPHTHIHTAQSASGRGVFCQFPLVFMCLL